MPLIDLARAKWQSSGLTDAQAKRLKLVPIANANRLASNLHAIGALKLPYFDLKGKPTKFYRVRYLERLPGTAGIVEKPQRYAQPVGTLNEVYLPPVLAKSWQAIADDPAISICITEGELKSACASVRNIPTIGLGGVDVWRSSKKGLAILPVLAAFKWEERTVYIVFDSDAAHNPNVVRAQRQLADELTGRGAKIYIVPLPGGADKVGLDDYLIKSGTEAFGALLSSAEPYSESNALWELNEEVVFIRKIDTVVERKTGLRMEPGRFMNHIYANRYFMAQEEKGAGKNRHVVLVKTPLAPTWIGWEKRSQLDGLTYRPDQPPLSATDGAWNTWPGWGLEPKKGDVGPWHWLMDFLFQDQHKLRKYFEQWCAYPLQRPGTKLFTAVVLWSRVKRMGKGSAFSALSKIYGENSVWIDNKQIKSGFNSWAKNRQLVIGDEIKADEARIDADWLKGVITNPTITINEKFQPEYVIPNSMNFGFLSNHPDTVLLEDGDKRYFVHEVLQRSVAPRDKYDKFWAWLAKDGARHLFRYLLDLKTDDFSPYEHAPETASKDAMIRAGKADAGLWVLTLQEDPARALAPLGMQEAAEHCDVFTPEQLFRAFDPDGRGRGRTTLGAFGKALTAAGYRQLNGGIPIGTSTGIHRLYAVRNLIDWEQATRKEIREHYDKFFGSKGELK